MPFALDPEIASALAAVSAENVFATLAPGDVVGLRTAINTVSLDIVFLSLPDTPDVEMTPHTVETADGGTISVSWYTKRQGNAGPAVIYAHGGGMIAGTAAHYDRLVRLYVSRTGVPFLNIDYRLAPEFCATGLARDMLAGLQWLLRHASSLGVDPDRVAVMGDSGGGGVAAAAAIFARESGITLARQILIYPMLDDRNISPDPFLAATATWSYENNATAWAAVTGAGWDEVTCHLAPGRLRDFSALPPAYIEVGEMDIFRDESIAYAQKLLQAGVGCELHIHPGAPHGHDWADPSSDLSRRVLSDRVRVIGTL